MADPTVTYAGWVYKEGSLIKNWKKRFLVVKHRELAYYKSSNPRSAELMGAMRIARAERAATITNGLIITSMEGRQLRLFMDTASERDKCYDAIAEWCHNKQEHAPALKPSTNTTSHTVERKSVASAPQPTPQMSGWLEKQGQTVPTWKRRFFVLQEGVLSYAAHESGPVLARHRVLGVRRDRTKPFTLELTLDSGRELRVSGESEHEIGDWQAAIRDTLQHPSASSSQDHPRQDLRENLTGGESWNNLFGAPPASNEPVAARDRADNVSFGRNLRLDFDGSFIECDVPVDERPKPKPFSPTAPSADSIRKLRIEKNLEDDESSTTTRVSSSQRPSSTHHESSAPGPCCCVVM